MYCVKPYEIKYLRIIKSTKFVEILGYFFQDFKLCIYILESKNFWI